jgi:hypothetical protein
MEHQHLLNLAFLGRKGREDPPPLVLGSSVVEDGGHD